MTAPPDLIELFIRPLERAGLEYMITGGVAVVIYGDPRFTRDVDLVLELAPERSSALLGAFDGDAFYLPPAAVLAEEVARPEGGHSSTTGTRGPTGTCGTSEWCCGSAGMRWTRMPWMSGVDVWSCPPSWNRRRTSTPTGNRPHLRQDHTPDPSGHPRPTPPGQPRQQRLHPRPPEQFQPQALRGGTLLQAVIEVEPLAPHLPLEAAQEHSRRIR